MDFYPVAVIVQKVITTKLHNSKIVHNRNGHILHAMNTLKIQLELHLELQYKHNS
jgi:hypothetical protein